MKSCPSVVISRVLVELPIKNKWISESFQQGSKNKNKPQVTHSYSWSQWLLPECGLVCFPSPKHFPWIAGLNANQELWLCRVNPVWLHQQGGPGCSIQLRVVIQQFSDTWKVMDFKEKAECRDEDLCRMAQLMITLHNFTVHWLSQTQNLQPKVPPWFFSMFNWVFFSFILRELSKRVILIMLGHFTLLFAKPFSHPLFHLSSHCTCEVHRAYTMT